MLILSFFYSSACSALDIYLNFNFSTWFIDVLVPSVDSTCVDIGGVCVCVCVMALLLLRFSLFSIFHRLHFLFSWKWCPLARWRRRRRWRRIWCVRSCQRSVVKYNVWEQFYPFVHTKTCALSKCERSEAVGIMAAKKTSPFDWQMANWHPAEPKWSVRRDTRSGCISIGVQLGVTGIYRKGERLSLRAQKVLVLLCICI